MGANAFSLKEGTQKARMNLACVINRRSWDLEHFRCVSACPCVCAHMRAHMYTSAERTSSLNQIFNWEDSHASLVNIFLEMKSRACSKSSSAIRNMRAFIYSKFRSPNTFSDSINGANKQKKLSNSLFLFCLISLAFGK